jgi:hypothetical protein
VPVFHYFGKKTKSVTRPPEKITSLLGKAAAPTQRTELIASSGLLQFAQRCRFLRQDSRAGVQACST